MHPKPATARRQPSDRQMPTGFNHLRLLIAFVAALSMSFLHAQVAQDENHRVGLNPKVTTVLVHVINPDGAPVPGAEIQLVNSKWQARSAKASKTGRAEFIDIQGGRYEIVVAAHGYQTFQRSLMVEETKTIEVEAKLVSGILPVQTPPAKPKP